MPILCVSLAGAACSAGAGDRRDDGDGGGAAQRAGAAASSNATGAGKAAGGQLLVADADVVRASAGEVQVRAGGRAEAEVRLDIAEGYHVNANPPTDKNLIGTELTIAGGEGVTPGAPVYPEALKKKFAFDERPLAVYERVAVIKLAIRADAKAAKGPQTLPARVRVQPCNDQACLPPRTIETTIRVTVN